MLYREVLLSAVLERVCVDNGCPTHAPHTYTRNTGQGDGETEEEEEGPGGGASETSTIASKRRQDNCTSECRVTRWEVTEENK